jgi:hypothetical protein
MGTKDLGWAARYPALLAVGLASLANEGPSVKVRAADAVVRQYVLALPDRFYARVAPTKVADPRVVKVNRTLAELLGANPEELASARARPFSSATRFR